ncbi:DUF1801 domain-containing protein [Maribacter hydrothermalis]|uniref:YdhG-like domain-containing protein n=1 Tax=Maribacter hydrothermalis TaxID=1836467 RepID=A0A1B7ZF26_9FLAO|nr:DUF1801 domain-containing protein [Maribacter hydrothermalis]APQ17668.1 hypothetical protein BTR34_10140 [Maribacter hydrothermalis]OBR42143.1 hypothetical protein A9200_01770 [Maribacter hydrothermalis]
MNYNANSIEEYINLLPQERRVVIEKLRQTILQNLPKGFEEQISYGMLGYVVPHSMYPAGYHVKPELPLPFINLASQKNFIALYHSGIYANTELLDWFVSEYPNHCKRKLDMGKSCIRFKSMDEIPYELIAKLCTKISIQEWISLYENNIKK